MPENTVKKGRIPPLPPRRRALRVVHSPDPSAVGRALDVDRLVIGRSGRGSGEIADEAMSREHARVFVEAGGTVVEDLGSGNGTYLNGTPISEVTPLVPNDVLSMGDTLLVLDQEPDPDALPIGEDPFENVPEVVGVSFWAERLRRSIVSVARAPGSVSILGPTGTGKDVVAGALHRLSSRAKGPFRPINAAAIPAGTAEAELFGSEEGAFTDAKKRSGMFQEASGGTLFLDEIGDLPIPVQAKLLRVLEDGQVQPLGGSPRKVDVRVFAATLLELEQTEFRRDLLARLGTWTLRLAPLAERRADILPLFDRFLERKRARSSELAEALLLHDWPQNVRELRKLAIRLSALISGDRALELGDLEERLQRAIRERDGGEGTPQAEPGTDGPRPAGAQPIPIPDRAQVEAALRETRGNMREAAGRLGLWRNQLYRLCKKYQLNPPDYR